MLRKKKENMSANTSKKLYIYSDYKNLDVDEYNVPQPDLVFVSKNKKHLITDDGIMGPPDLMIEIISPTSIIRDRVEKKKLYKQYQIPEYWIVDIKYKSIEVYFFEPEDYELFSHATEQGKIQSKVLEKYELDLKDVFED